jgi:hypothetical protein
VFGKSGIELIEDAQKEIAVVPKARWKLEEKTAEFFPKDLAHGVKPAQKLLGSLEFSEVRNSPKGFEGEKEALRPLSVPGLHHLLRGEAIKSGVHFHSVENFGIKIEPFALGKVLRIEEARPMWINPA